MKSMREMINLMEGVSAVPGLNLHSIDAHVDEKAPPGREKQVKALKKEFPGDEERAFATAWASYNKSHGKKNECGPGMEKSISEEEVDEAYTDVCNQSNPTDCRDACKMEEDYMYQMEESTGKVAEIIEKLHALDGLYSQEEVFDMIAAQLASEGYAEDEINELFQAVDHELGIAGGHHVGDEQSDVDDSMDGDFDSAMASAGHGSDEDYGPGASDMYEGDFPMGQVSPEKINHALAALRQAVDTGADPQQEVHWIAKTHNVPVNDLVDAWKAQGTMEEAFDLNNGYDDIENANPQDYFPSGADSPVMRSVGGNAKQGDNPEQKSVRISEETADVHKELVYSYRNFLNESRK